MFTTTPIPATASKTELYEEAARQMRGLLRGEHNPVANAANFSALVFHALPDISWCGFYFPDETGDGLVVGPFQGKPACVRLSHGKGVCGAAVTTRRTQVVPDVTTFPGHIYCDGAARSEIVVPLFRTDGSLVGVWDVDSYSVGRFDEDDRIGMEALCLQFIQTLAVPPRRQPAAS
ncbi:MAG: GAF domain-containing protein [Burkholderiaceae bacterium]|nr:MAG: GAF domain-containing protein [Burkholderiaceae bacterium]